MKYLINWINKELKPDRYVKSLSTTSSYFFIHGAKIRLADHIGHDDADLQIIIVKDLLGKNKQYLVKESKYPTYVSVPDIKTLKIVITTFLFHFNNMYSKKVIDDSSINSIPDVTRLISIVNEKYPDYTLDEKEQTFKTAINKLRCGIDLNTAETTVYGTFMNAVPMWSYFSVALRKRLKCLLRYKTLNELINIINNEFKNEDVLKTINGDLRLEIIASYFPKDISSTFSNEDNISETAINSEETLIKKSSQDYISHLNALNNIYKSIGARTFDGSSSKTKNKLYNIFGHIMSIDTNNMYSKTTSGQRKKIRELAIKKVPYDVITTFFNRTMHNDGNILIPNATTLDVYVKRFLKLYNIGIIKYPDEDDFMTYGTDGNTKAEKQELKIIGHIDLDKPITEQEIVPVESEEIVEKTVDEQITEVVESPTYSAPIIERITFDITNEYEYGNSDFNIQNVTSLFDDNQINIVDTVIKKIIDNQKATSFETKRLHEVFSKHYTDIWSRLSNTQRELCTSIITDEHMNLNEADFIINKVFNKDTVKWPVTEVCRKYIAEYCRRVREARMAA